MVDGVKAMGYQSPRRSSFALFRLFLLGRTSSAASAQTGTGKTAAFTLHPFQTWRPFGRAARPHPRTHPRTRFQRGDRHSRFRAVHQIARGGVLWRRGLWKANGRLALRFGSSIIATPRTPARSYRARGTYKLNNIKYLVLDEADRMLDMEAFSPTSAASWTKSSARTPHLAFLRHDSRPDRDAHQMGDEDSADD